MRNYFFNPNSLVKTQAIKKRNIDTHKEERWIDTSFQIAILLCSMALHDVEGFGSTRLMRLIDKVNDLLDSYEKGYLTMEDINNTLDDECKMMIDGLKLTGFK